jgi:hypothetical protein
MLALAICIILLLLCLSGCSAHKTEIYEATFSTGCYFNVKAANAEKANAIKNNWDVTDCEIEMKQDVEEIKKE